jgi:hypothetical protein
VSRQDRDADPERTDRLARRDTLDDETVDALLAGRPVDGRHARLAVVVDTVRAVRTASAPAPSAKLAALFAVPEPGRRKTGHRRRVLRVAGGASLATKLALGAGAAAAAAGGASATGVLPEPVERVVHEISDVVTPARDDGTPREPAPTPPPPVSVEDRGPEPSVPVPTVATTVPDAAAHEADPTPPRGSTSTTIGEDARGKPPETPGNPPDHAGPPDNPGNDNGNANGNANANGNGNGLDK